MLHNVMSINLHTSILGHQIGMPLCIAPSALHGLLHPDGEKATASGKFTFFLLIHNLMIVLL